MGYFSEKVWMDLVARGRISGCLSKSGRCVGVFCMLAILLARLLACTHEDGELRVAYIDIIETELLLIL